MLNLKSLFHSLMPARRPAVPQSRRARPRLEVLEDRNAPAMLTWAGAAGGLWSVGGNWTGGTGVAPANNDTLLLAKNTSSQDDIANLSLFKLDIQNTYKSTLTLAQDLTVTGTVNMAGAGKIDGVAKTLTLPNGSSVLNWSSGEIASKVVLGKNGTNPTVNITGAVTLSSTSFDSFATTIWTGGDSTMGNGSKFTNEASATFDARSDQKILVPVGTAGFSNAGGTFKKSLGAGTTEIRSSFTTTGPLIAGSGNIYFSGAALFTQNAGGVITLNGGSLQTLVASTSQEANWREPERSRAGSPPALAGCPERSISWAVTTPRQGSANWSSTWLPGVSDF